MEEKIEYLITGIEWYFQIGKDKPEYKKYLSKEGLEGKRFPTKKDAEEALSRLHDKYGGTLEGDCLDLEDAHFWIESTDPMEILGRFFNTFGFGDIPNEFGD